MQIPAMSSALEGMSRAETQLNQAAGDIARAATTDPAIPVPRVNGDIVDLSASMVSLLQSRNSFDANTKVLKVADEMQKSLLNVVG
ncbi:MAG TPA: flagellar basal body rod C-terminal domain-containing protein [Bryobacteraceae bacterium]|nr:flagellar basal body rod C-terminal domain-containing protein [Bryobacteraceae bacterium]